MREGERERGGMREGESEGGREGGRKGKVRLVPVSYLEAMAVSE